MMTTTISLFRPLSLVAALALYAAQGVGTVAAQTSFDGTWSVQIVAENGNCGARTVAIQVQDGNVSYAGYGASAEGAIGADGRLKANFTHGENVVKAKGAVSGQLGSGSWSSKTCDGNWTARRG